MHRNSKPKTMQEQRVDPRLTTAEEHAEGVRQAQVLFKLNHTMPYTDEYNALVRELFGVNLGEGGWVMPGLTGVCFDRVHIGKNVMIMNNCLMMARGGITIDRPLRPSNPPLQACPHLRKRLDRCWCYHFARRNRRKECRRGRWCGSHQGCGTQYHRGRQSCKIH